MGQVAAITVEEVPSHEATGRALRLFILLGIYVLIAHILPRPESISPAGWRVTAIFAATMAGLMLRPLPGAALVLIGLSALVAVAEVPMAQALSGFAAPPVWLVLLAMVLSRVLQDTGAARRIALVFVRLFGRSSLGLSYSLVMTDVTLAVGIPSITARSAGVILPVARSIAELYGSSPGSTSKLLGKFLMTSLYQGSIVACAMFLTGQASNVLAAKLASDEAGIVVTWSSWFLAGLVPGIVSCLVVPYIVYRLLTPGIRETPGASDYARDELEKMGPIQGREGLSLAVFVLVAGVWMTSGWHRIDVTLVAFAAIGCFLSSGLLSWERVVGDAAAWDVLVWYGGLFTMGESLNETGATRAFAEAVRSSFVDVPWYWVLPVSLVIYFYSHYGFASITTHLLAMFPPFLVMLIAAGTPPGLAVYSLACFANLTAGLTHYGTTTAPIVFSQKYVEMEEWWRVGFIVSLANLAIWTIVGFAWWKLIGFW
ncbi:MAG: DASS family sodium-coupled anion symporter [Vicinamibacteria bacterium]